ncbi:PASTA domain-containing protein [Micromonospora sp. NPDC005367]|uniref:PASTA domain-containing protein n=1 Tax=Micromonospora sp. NPDC005367 TaxID=3155590 RepID=UPI0033B73887
MNHEPGPTTWQGQQPSPPQQPYPQQQPYPNMPPPGKPKRKLGTGAIIAITIGALVIACCGITGVAALVTGDSEPDAAPSSSPTVAAAAERDAQAPATATPAAPSSEAAPPPPATTAPATPAAPEKITMPNLKGENAAVADDKLRKLGFTNLQYGSADENDTLVIMLANWTVTKQSAKPGAKLNPDDLIVLTCTKQN